MADQYVKESISGLSRKEYLSFFLKFFSLAKENLKANARIAFLNADWRDFQGVSAMEENPARSTDLVKALIVAWYGQLYFQVVSVSPWLNWTIEMLTI